MKVVQINCVIDHASRTETLPDVWPTMPAVAEAVAGAGADVTILQASRVPADFVRLGVRYRFVPEKRFKASDGAGLSPRQLARALHEECADIVHFNGLDFPLHARAIGLTGVPMILQDHASNARSRWSRLRGWGHAQVAAALFTAEAQAEPFLAARQLPPGTPIFTVPESSSSFEPGDRAEARARTGVHGNPAILWVGRLDANKDPLTAIEAFRLTRSHLPEAELWCVHGTDALLPELERRLAGDPGLARRVHLLGRVPHRQVEQLCRSCDLFLATSHREGSGYALIEALACGMPAVASDIAPFRAIVGDLVEGRFAAPGNAPRFAEGLVSLARRDSARSRAAVRRHFGTHLAFPVIGRRLVDIYETVLARGTRR